MWPDLYRSSQPSPSQIGSLYKQRLRYIINLRGANKNNCFYYVENRACQKLGVKLLSIDFYPNGMLPPPQSLLTFLEFISEIKEGVLFHCKSGADRTGFAAALCVLMCQKNDIEAARKQLTWKYLHLRSRKMGIFDHAIDAFEIAHGRTGIGVIKWIETAYDPEDLRRTYALKIGQQR